MTCSLSSPSPPPNRRRCRRTWPSSRMTSAVLPPSPPHCHQLRRRSLPGRPRPTYGPPAATADRSAATSSPGSVETDRPATAAGARSATGGCASAEYRTAAGRTAVAVRWSNCCRTEDRTAAVEVVCRRAASRRRSTTAAGLVRTSPVDRQTHPTTIRQAACIGRRVHGPCCRREDDT